MGRRKIDAIVRQFMDLSEDERYATLSLIVEGHAETKSELKYRAELCTALERAGVYPARSPLEDSLDAPL